VWPHDHDHGPSIVDPRVTLAESESLGFPDAHILDQNVVHCHVSGTFNDRSVTQTDFLEIQIVVFAMLSTISRSARRVYPEIQTCFRSVSSTNASMNTSIRPDVRFLP